MNKVAEIIEEFVDCIPEHLEEKPDAYGFEKSLIEYKYICRGMAKEIIKLRSSQQPHI